MTSPHLLFDLGISHTDRLARYLKVSFHSKITLNAAPPIIPEGFPLEVVIECDWAAYLLSEAFKNTKRTSWSIRSYRDYLIQASPCSTGRNEVLERKLLAAFPPLSHDAADSYIVNPCVVADKDGLILLWYLPRLLKEDRRMSMWKSLTVMEKHMYMSPSSLSWRSNSENFNPTENCVIRPGTFSIAPFWFQQAHSGVNKLEVSAKMRKLEGLAWSQEMRHSSALIGAVLAVMHPQQYRGTVEGTVHVAHNPQLIDKADDLAEILQAWSAPFTGISVMNNRQTPSHRDNGGFYETMDLLASVGPYRTAVMRLPSLGLKLTYPSGTVVGLTGRLVPHAVQAEGERACFAYYLKETVWKATSKQTVDFARLDDV